MRFKPLKRTWRERIAAARVRGRFTAADIEAAGESWTTCAVGEQWRLHPLVVRMSDECECCRPQPYDPDLGRLGGGPDGFGMAVCHQDIDRAEALLDQIEDRVLTLKREVPDDVA